MIDLKAVCTPAQAQAFIEFEKIVLNYVKSNFDNLVKQIIGKNVLSDYLVGGTTDSFIGAHIAPRIDQLEQNLYMVMQEDGKIDGIKLNAIIKSKKPFLSHFVNIPNEPFTLSDIAIKLTKYIGSFL